MGEFRFWLQRQPVFVRRCYVLVCLPLTWPFMAALILPLAIYEGCREFRSHWHEAYGQRINEGLRELWSQP